LFFAVEKLMAAKNLPKTLEAVTTYLKVAERYHEDMETELTVARGWSLNSSCCRDILICF
jgi:hypothetical protein